MTRIETDIMISGGGVAGLGAAAAFGTAGFRVLIVDPAPPVTTNDAKGAGLRTTAFLQPAKGFLDRAGLWDRLPPQICPLAGTCPTGCCGAKWSRDWPNYPM